MEKKDIKAAINAETPATMMAAFASLLPVPPGRDSSPVTCIKLAMSGLGTCYLREGRGADPINGTSKHGQCDILEQVQTDVSPTDKGPEWAFSSVPEVVKCA